MRTTTALALCLTACASVEIPVERCYRIELPRPGASAIQEPSILRVQPIQISRALQVDRLMVQKAPFDLMAYELDRWAGPLDELVLDAVVTGLTRSQAFAQIKSPWDGGREDLQLSARVLDFHEVRDGASASGRATLELKITRSADGKALWTKEITRSEPAAPGEPRAVVAALSQAMAGIVDDVLSGCRASGVLATPGR